MQVKEIEVNIKKTVSGYFKDYCMGCPYSDLEVSNKLKMDNTTKEFIILYECKNKDVCERIHRICSK